MQVGNEKSKTSVFAISGTSKIHRTYKHSNTCHGFYIYHIFFLNARNNPFWKINSFLSEVSVC